MLNSYLKVILLKTLKMTGDNFFSKHLWCVYSYEFSNPLLLWLKYNQLNFTKTEIKTRNIYAHSSQANSRKLRIHQI